jgi:hypothetical protein
MQVHLDLSIETAINLIGNTTTSTNLNVVCLHDDNRYALAKKVPDETSNAISLEKIPPFESWNYKILPA